MGKTDVPMAVQHVMFDGCRLCGHDLLVDLHGCDIEIWISRLVGGVRVYWCTSPIQAGMPKSRNQVQAIAWLHARRKLGPNRAFSTCSSDWCRTKSNDVRAWWSRKESCWVVASSCSHDICLGLPAQLWRWRVCAGSVLWRLSQVCGGQHSRVGATVICARETGLLKDIPCPAGARRQRKTMSTHLSADQAFCVSCLAVAIAWQRYAKASGCPLGCRSQEGMQCISAAMVPLC